MSEIDNVLFRVIELIKVKRSQGTKPLRRSKLYNEMSEGVKDQQGRATNSGSQSKVVRFERFRSILIKCFFNESLAKSTIILNASFRDHIEGFVGVQNHKCSQVSWTRSQWKHFHSDLYNSGFRRQRLSIVGSSSNINFLRKF